MKYKIIVKQIEIVEVDALTADGAIKKLKIKYYNKIQEHWLK